MNSKAKSEPEDIISNAIDKSVDIMQNYGFNGITRKMLVKNSGAMNFLRGALRQQGLTEGQIKEAEDLLQKEEENQAVK